MCLHPGSGRTRNCESNRWCSYPCRTVGILKRQEPGYEPPEIHVYGGTITGRKFGKAAPDDGRIGTFYQGRPATEANLKGARRWFPEANSADFKVLSKRELVDRASGTIYRVLTSDPLLSENPAGMCDMFFVAYEQIWWLRSTGETTAQRDVAAAKRAKLEAQAAEERAKRRAKEKQIAVPLSVLGGERLQLTVREAAARILDAGGRIERGEVEGTLRITHPERITGEPFSERAALTAFATAAEVLSCVPRVVLAALADADPKQPRSLLALLPAREPALGGGVT
jgi:hypothetical protein